MFSSKMPSVIVLFLFAVVVQNIVTTQGSVEDHKNSEFYRRLSDIVGQRIEELVESKMDDLIERLKIKIKELTRTSNSLFDQASNAIKMTKNKRRENLESLKRKMEGKIKTKGMTIVNRTEHVLIKGISDMRSLTPITKNDIQSKIDDSFKRLRDDVHNETILARTRMNKQTSDFFRSISFQPPEAIYFSAILSHNFGPTVDNVKFDSVLTNKGAGYDSQTGIFTAPRSGCYVFTCTFLAGNGYVNVQMMKNGNEIAKGYAAEHNEENNGVLSENIELMMGDQIGIRLIHDRSTGVIRGDFYSTFSGLMTELQ